MWRDTGQSLLIGELIAEWPDARQQRLIGELTAQWRFLAITFER